jgi:type I restriction enzyme R subunit
MTYDLGNESKLVEIPALEHLKVLGYHHLPGALTLPINGERESISEVILEKRFRQAIRRLNPWIDDGNVTKVYNYISRADGLGAGLLEINEHLYRDIVDLRFTVDQAVDGPKKTHTVRFVDFDDPDKNEWLAVNQFEVQGPNEKIIPDIVLFLNGMPIVVLECKSPFKEISQNENIGKHDAFKQLQRYMGTREGAFLEGQPRLFHTNFLLGLLNRYHAFAGTITSPYSNYLEWKDPYPACAEDHKEPGQNLFLQGMLERRNLLDIMRHFIVFEDDGKGKRAKKICRYQQFRAVDKAVDRLLIGKDTLTRGGVIWHTQGSGKSLTMVFLVRKIRTHPLLSDATILIVTDRVDLDDQITATFQRTLGYQFTPHQAETIEDLKKTLAITAPQIVLTIINKFAGEEVESGISSKDGSSLKYEKEFPVLNANHNLIVLADEAHRSQYTGMAANMRKALPNAAFIGFTGTPLERDDVNTRRTFGSYIDKYSIQQSVDDGATVMIVYEGRKPDLHIKGDTLEALFDEAFAERSDMEKEAIKAKYATKQSINEADARIDEIVRDMLVHYRDTVLPNGFKAQIVCISREACVKYYDAFEKHAKVVLGEGITATVIFSSELNDEPHLRVHYKTKEEQKAQIKRFLMPQAEDSLSFLIVKDMLLTGFDAPVEQVMYLDRPLKEHGLLQAIARVNRTNGEKKLCGYVVDYFGVSDHLKEALAIFDDADIGKDGPMTSLDALFKQMQDCHAAALRIFGGINRNDLDALVRHLKPEDRRAEFVLAFKRYASSIERLLPHRVPVEYLNDLRWLAYIRAAVKARYEPGVGLDISDCGEKVRRIISDHLESKGILPWIAPMEIFDADFAEKVGRLGSDEAVASAMEHAAKREIHIRLEKNPVFYTSLLEKLQKILAETEADWEERRRLLKAFIESDLVRGETVEAASLRMTPEEFAYYAVARDKLGLTTDGYMKPEDGLPLREGSGYVYDADFIPDALQLAKRVAVDIALVVQENCVVDWAQNPVKVGNVEREIASMLTKKYHTWLPLKQRKEMLPSLVQIAKQHRGGV